MNHFFTKTVIPIDKWANEFVPWLTAQTREFFQTIQSPVDWAFDTLNDALVGLPDMIGWIALVLIAWKLAGWRIALFTAVAMGLLGGWNPILPHIDVWDQTMTTLALVVIAVIISVLIGVPVGIVASKSDRFESLLRPALDAMQTTPSFVYLIPIVMLIGLGAVAGVFATFVFAVPPMIRLTNLGIREVDREVVEAAQSFGATGRQVMFDIQLPLALRTIMAGVNQTLMLSLSMVVIASIIGAPGLGLLVRQGINQLNFGAGAVGGTGIVLLAIVLDRMTQSLGKPNENASPTISMKAVFGRVWNRMMSGRNNTGSPV
ncbi:MAG: proline/glycine betaine ABC transporter permease [Chloroflexi bacterium]|nr:proline/glycine betaine ABC transporter permease [Chloroflexota bacterium]